MTREFPEGGLVLVAGDGWALLKWDDSDAYRKGISRLNGELDGRAEGTKALDFVGVSGQGDLYLIELKDFRGHRIENKLRQAGELPLEVALKVRDTLAGVLGAAREPMASDEIAAVVNALLRVRASIRVIVCVAEDLPIDRRKQDVIASERLSQLKKRLSWFTRKVFVASPDDMIRVAPGLYTRNRAVEA